MNFENSLIGMLRPYHSERTPCSFQISVSPFSTEVYLGVTLVYGQTTLDISDGNIVDQQVEFM